jgi:hypothetical protein
VNGLCSEDVDQLRVDPGIEDRPVGRLMVLVLQDRLHQAELSPALERVVLVGLGELGKLSIKNLPSLLVRANLGVTDLSIGVVDSGCLEEGE